MKLSRKKIIIIIIIGGLLVGIGIAIKFVMTYLLLPEEKQHLAFYQQCYTSGGTVKSKSGSQCGGNTCWDQLQLGVQICGYGTYLYADCFCGEGQCWDDAVGRCVSKEQYAEQYDETVWQL
ncbi:MAG: hypothetical protein HYV33_03155 [Candidatus Kerfeldbacteria bacterium]|nr:hypothetical protein [Candidatus Kerfeldbacteria bacterium]